MEFLFLFLGLAALLAVVDTLFSSSDTDPEEDTPPEDEESRVTGTAEDDLLIGRGGQIVDALDGDDTIVAVGDDTVFAGPGNDTIIALADARMFGQEGDDIFVIAPAALDANAESWPVIGDFNPDSDLLVIDLRGIGLGDAGTEENPVILTGSLAPDGEGLIVQANGVDLVQLSSYGGGDMQAALEDLVTDFEAIEVIGAAFDFPPDPDALPDGVNVDVDDSQLVFTITEDYSGGGTLALPSDPDLQDFPVTIDLSALSRDAAIVFHDDGNGTLTVGDLPPTQIKLPISTITLGKGDDTIDLRRANEDAIGPDGVTINADAGTNDINIGRSIAGEFNLSGGENRILAKGAVVNISGGDNTISNSKATSDRVFKVTLEPNSDSITTMEGARVDLTVIYTDLALAESREVESSRSKGIYRLTWDGGSFETEQFRFVTEDFSGLYDPTLPQGVERIDPPEGQDPDDEDTPLIFGTSYVISDGFAGGGTIGEKPFRQDIVDLTGFSGNVVIEDDQFGQPLLIIEGQEDNPTLLKGILTVKLGTETNLVTSGKVWVDIVDGENKLDIDSRSRTFINIDGGTNDIAKRGIGSAFLEISGGENTVFIGNKALGNFIFTEEATGDTTIRNGVDSEFVFKQPGPDMSAVVTNNGLTAEWGDGSTEINARGRPVFVTVYEGATIDLSAVSDNMAYDLRISVIRFIDPIDELDVPRETTIIGELNDRIDLRLPTPVA